MGGCEKDLRVVGVRKIGESGWGEKDRGEWRVKIDWRDWWGKVVRVRRIGEIRGVRRIWECGGG